MPPPDSEELYGRARKSAENLLELCLKLSTGAAAAYFLLLANKPDIINNEERYGWAFASIALFVVSVLFALAGSGLNSLFYATWAKAEAFNDLIPEKIKLTDKKEQYRDMRRVFFFLAALAFGLGVLSSGVFLFYVIRLPSETAAFSPMSLAFEGLTLLGLLHSPPPASSTNRGSSQTPTAACPCYAVTA